MIDLRARQPFAIIVCALGIAGCSSGSPATFSVSNAAVDSTYTCPVAATNAPYDLHGTINAHNGTPNAVTISSANATLTLAAVNGGWLQKVGDKYEAGNVTVSPTSVDSGGSTTLAVTIPSSCTGRTAKGTVASGDYAVTFTIVTSAGTFKVNSKDRHRILTA
jgi:hypothetical protein